MLCRPILGWLLCRPKTWRLPTIEIDPTPFKKRKGRRAVLDYLLLAKCTKCTECTTKLTVLLSPSPLPTSLVMVRISVSSLDCVHGLNVKERVRPPSCASPYPLMLLAEGAPGTSVRSGDPCHTHRCKYFVYEG